MPDELTPPGTLDVPGEPGKPNGLDYFFRCVPVPDGWAFQVGVVVWARPHEPVMEWNTVRRWKTWPDAARLVRARKAVVTGGRYFQTCSICHAPHNVGHMHSNEICQCCAESEFRVVY